MLKSDDSARSSGPSLDADSREFWEGAARGELRVQQCASCRRHQYYPRVHCTSCGSTVLDWVTASGRGSVHSFTISHRDVSALPIHRPPYVVALVDLDEGVRMLTNLVDVDLDPRPDLIGRRVEVRFVDTGEGWVLPVFALDTTEDTQ